MMNNFPVQFEPQSWADVKNQESIVNRLRRKIRTNLWPPSMFFCGPSGCGKTSTVRLMIKATHCLKRNLGEDEPCGGCSSCKSDPMESTSINNVVWVKPASRESSESDKLVSYESQIKEAFAMAERGPVQSQSPHRDVLFVVFDECHLMPDPLRQRALSFADVQHPLNGDVVIVFITMQPEKITSTPFTAMTQRGSYLQFKRPTDLQLQEFLQEKFPELSAESAVLIARASQGSYRGALQLYNECLEEDGYVSPTMVADVLRLADPQQRCELWRRLYCKEPLSEVKAYFEELCTGITPSTLMHQLHDDFLKSLEHLEQKDILFAARVFHEYFINPTYANAIYVLFELSGREVVSYKVFA